MNFNIYVSYRHPRVAIEVETGEVYVGKCDCPQSSGGQCSHVANILFMTEEIKEGAQPRIDPTCTSKSQGWGKLLAIITGYSWQELPKLFDI